MRATRGFTLLEILVVVIIIAILTALMAPNLLGGDRQRELRREAQSLLLHIQVAQDEAMLSGLELGIEFAADGFRFVQWDSGRGYFTDIADEQLRWREHALPEGMSLALSGIAREPLLVVPEADERKARQHDAGAGSDEAPPPVRNPQVFVLSSGEVTPFTATFTAEGDPRPVTLSVDVLGRAVEADEEGAAVAAQAGDGPLPAR